MTENIALFDIPTREKIDQFQEILSQYPQIELETTHYFADGMYCRELFRPAGATIVGKVHKKEHFYIVLSGEVTIVNAGSRERVKAPKIFISPPGTKRAVYAHVDSICITVHRTDKTDIHEIERELVEEDEKALFDAENHLKQDLLT